MKNQRDLKFRSFIAAELKSNSVLIADLWLNRLVDVVNESTRDIFPTEQFLDHVPMLIEEIGTVLEVPDEDLALSNSLLASKADQLGTLRHQQRATVNQLLREYDLLSKVLEHFILDKAKEYEHNIPSESSIELMASVARIVRSILQSTVDSFVEKYMTTIKDQTDKIVSFNAFVSHELKTPLQAALLNMELLMETKDLTTDDVRDLIKVQSSLQQATSLLKNIENLIQNSDTTIDDSPTVQEIDLSALVRDVCKQLVETSDSRNVQLSVDDNLGSVLSETAKVKLVFTNLLSNSVKYSDPDKAERRVWVTGSDKKSKENVYIIVGDNGLGIDEHMQKEVFKLRVRAHQTDD